MQSKGGFIRGGVIENGKVRPRRMWYLNGALKEEWWRDAQEND